MPCHRDSGVVNKIRNKEAHDRLVDSVNHVHPELGLCPFESENSTSVELRHRKRHLVVNVLVENAHENDGKRGKGEVVEQNVCVLKEV